MYQPLLHRQEQLEAQHALIRSHPLGLLISNGAQGLEANSIPFLIDPSASRFGTLQAHMARANGQWRSLSEASEVLVIFQGAERFSKGSIQSKRLQMITRTALWWLIQSGMLLYRAQGNSC